jgi:hypothetical protein
MLYRIDWPKALVISVLALVVGVLQFTGKLPPEWAAGVGTLAVLVAGALKSFIGSSLKPPVLPLLLLVLAGCGASTPTLVQQEDVAKDLRLQTECVDLNATKAGIDACRAGVKARRDGGT